jgi:hypothetical protein
MDLSSVIIIVLSLSLCVSLYFVVRFGLVILKIEDAIEESLDVLDERYRSISEILEIPLFYDSPQIRQVVHDIKLCRNSVLKIAQSFASIDERKEQNSSEEQTDA